MATVANIYLIKDLSRLSGHSVHTLKFYLKLGLVHEVGRSPQTHFRYFDDTTLAALSRIRALRKERKSLAEIQQLLASTQDSRPPGPPIITAGAGKTQNTTRGDAGSPVSGLQSPVSVVA